MSKARLVIAALPAALLIASLVGCGDGKSGSADGAASSSKGLAGALSDDEAPQAKPAVKAPEPKPAEKPEATPEKKPEPVAKPAPDVSAPSEPEVAAKPDAGPAPAADTSVAEVPAPAGPKIPDTPAGRICKSAVENEFALRSEHSKLIKEMGGAVLANPAKLTELVLVCAQNFDVTKDVVGCKATATSIDALEACEKKAEVEPPEPVAPPVATAKGPCVMLATCCAALAQRQPAVGAHCAGLQALADTPDAAQHCPRMLDAMVQSFTARKQPVPPACLPTTIR